MKIGEFIFKFRGITPIPFLIVAIILAEPREDLVVFGGILMIAGELLRLAGVSYAGASTRARELVTEKLITNGPYAYVRNPMYFGNVLMYAGASILAGAWLPYLLYLVIIFFSIQYGICVRYEEAYLEKIFSEEYIRYNNLVPRFFPRISPYPDRGHDKPDLIAAFFSEKTTFLGILGFLILISVRLYFIS